MSLFAILAVLSHYQSHFAIVLCGFCIIFYIGLIFAVVYVGQLVKDEVAEAIRLVYKSINLWKSEVIEARLSRLAMQLSHRSPIFTNGLFTFDLKFFLSVSSLSVVNVMFS
jgi:hypothetical protein